MPPPPPRVSIDSGAPPPSQPPPPPASEPSGSLDGPVTISSRQHQAVSGLLASLLNTAARGGERLQRLQRVLAAIAGDAAEPQRVSAVAASVAGLGRELASLQASNAQFAGALQAAGTRSELADVKARLEAHQARLTAWEEKVRAALEAITELQAPSRRTSMLALSAGGPRGSRAGLPQAPMSAPVSPALWDGGAGLPAALPPLPPRRSAFTPGPSMGDGASWC